MINIKRKNDPDSDDRPNSQKGLWKRLQHFIKANTSLTVIIVAALLLELTTGILFYSAQNIIKHNAQRLIEREMNALYLCIRNKLAQVEVTVDNMSWVVNRDLQQANWMYEITELLVKNNTFIQSSGIAFTPDYYPKQGRWFEPCAIRKEDGSIESKQLGSANHDYTKAEFYTVPMVTGKCHWCEPYMDKDGSKNEVTTYSVPVRLDDGKIVAVIIVDISLDWLEDIMNEEKVYKSTRRFLTTGHYTLLAGDDTPIFNEALKIIRADDDKKGYFTLNDEKGNKQHVFYTAIGGKTDWVLVNILDDNDVFGKLRRIRLSLLLPVMIGLLFIGFIVWRSSCNLERLRKMNAEKERIDSELRIANHIQQSMLPGQHLQRDDVDIFGSLVPAREVGGDLFDYYVRDEKLFFCIGDVSGKGTPSAMVMSVIHSLFRAFSAHESNPAHIMQNINEASCQGNDSNMFVTMLIGVLDLPTGNLRYCDAGHDSPFVIKNGDISMEECKPHLPLGVFEDIKYETQETMLAPDSTLFLYTDGLTEAKKGHKQYFGIQRTKEVIGHCAKERLIPQQIIERVTEAVHQYVGDAEQSDDLTMLVIHYTPKQFESKLTETLVIKNDVHEVKRLNDFQKSVFAELNLERPLVRKLQLAVEEAVVNVIDYAYPIGTEGLIEIRMMYDGKSLKIMIIDSGVAFDPTLKEKADTTLSAEDRQIGGLGIHLVREIMDTINYIREGGKNVLTLIKNF